MPLKLLRVGSTWYGDLVKQEKIASELAISLDVSVAIMVKTTKRSLLKRSSPLNVTLVSVSNLLLSLGDQKNVDSIIYLGGRASISTNGEPIANASIIMKNMIRITTVVIVAATGLREIFGALGVKLVGMIMKP